MADQSRRAVTPHMRLRGLTAVGPELRRRTTDIMQIPAASIWATRDFLQDRRLARLGPGARRDALFWAAHPCLGVAHFRSAARRAL